MARILVFLPLLLLAACDGGPREGTLEYFAEETRQAVLNRDIAFFRAHGVSEYHFDGEGFAPAVEAWLYDDDYLDERMGEPQFTSVETILRHKNVHPVIVRDLRDFNAAGVRTHLITYITEDELYDHDHVDDYMVSFAVVEVVQLEGEWVFVDPLFASLPGHWLRSEFEPTR